MISIGDYNTIMNDRNIFNQIVYTPLPQALKLLEERQNDEVLMAKISELLNGDIPEVLKCNRCGILARQLATPNIDTQRFIKIARENNLKIVLFEYPEDKFVSKNNFKHSLGQIRVSNGVNSLGKEMMEKINIIDLVKYDGKKFHEIPTLWGEPLIDFHRKLFKHYELPDDLVFYNIGEWYNRNGGNAINYYTNFMLLFVAHGILFENFLTTKDSEGKFTEEIVLPSINNIINLTGVKPLVVPISSMDNESEEFWISHSPNIKKLILNNKS